jgi:hypothetical protein
MLADTLRKEMREWEDTLVSLRKRELNKDDTHYEPGNHETPGTGVAPHTEPGNHESHAFGPGGLRTQIGEEPVGSDTGVPMNGQPADSTPGGEVCPMCNQPDLPGSCQCLGGTAPAAGGDVDGFDRPDADLGADADLGGGDLQLGELGKAEKPKTGDVLSRGALKTKVLHSETHPHGHYHVEDHGAGVHGVFYTSKRARKPQYIATGSSVEDAQKRIKQHVDGKYGSHNATKSEKNETMGYGGTEPVESGSGDMNAGQGDISGTSLVQGEKTHVCKGPLCTKGLSGSSEYCKACQPKPKKEEKPMKKDLASATADLKAKNQMLDSANKVRATKPMFQPKFTKEEWIDIANEGDPVKRLKNSPDGASETAVPAAVGDKGAEKRGQGVDVKRVKSANDSDIKPEVKKSAVPEAKPPSGQNMGTAVPKAKVQAPKLPGASAMPKPAAAPKLPGMGKAPKLGGMVQPGSPAGVVKGESVPEKHKKAVAAQDAKMPKPMKDMMSPPVKTTAKGEESLEKGKLGRLAAGALATGALMTGAAVKPALDHAKAKVAVSAPAAKPTVVAQKSDVWAGEGVPEQHEKAVAPKKTFGMADLAAGKAKLQAQGVQPQSKLGTGPSVPGLKAPPKLPGMGAPTAPVKKPLFGKGEMENLKCSMCKGAEHPGDCK